MHANVLISRAQLSIKGRSSENPFFSILNALGILGSGIVAALFALKKKEKATSDATIEYVSNLNKLIVLLCGKFLPTSICQTKIVSK